jgi:undecaprenyl-diphosphatase
MIRTRSMHFVALVAAFIIFSAVVASGVTFGADEAAIRYFKSTHGNASLDAVMITITSMGDVTTLFLLGIVLTIIRRTRKAGMIFLIALILIVVLVMYIKPVVGRDVPSRFKSPSGIYPYTLEPALELPENFTIENDSIVPFARDLSYPSGHAARATALAFILGFAIYNKSRKAGYAIWAFPIIMGITRLYLMQHYPTDIIGGFLFGGMVSVILANAMKLDQPFFMSRIKGREDEPQHSGNL